MTDIVTLTNLTKTYNGIPALRDVTMSIPSGKIIGLLGPNGSGKTTLIKILNGLLQPTSGLVTINGFQPSPITKAQVAYLPDTTYLDESKTIQYYLDFFQDFYADFRYPLALQLLQDLKLQPDLRLKNLSKGNKEKLQLILVMSREAKLYLLDEPIGGVDPASRDYILKTIINQYSEDASVIISTHLIADIESVLDEVVFLKYGQIELQGDADNIRQAHGKSIDKLFREMFHN
jgi:ABC-type multidrug transport system, ATPase component